MKVLYFIFLLTLNTLFGEFQTCEKLMSEVKRYGKLQDTKTPLSSEAIAKAEYYSYDNTGFAIVYFKKGDSTYGSRPYIYCNVSSQRWKAFIDRGAYGSWGESFNKYIRSYTCDC